MPERHVIGWASVAVVFIAAMGTGMYYAGFHADRSKYKRDVSAEIREEISAQNIDRYLKHLTSVPHLAGTDQDFEQAEWMMKKLIHYGVDHAEVVPYKVLLSYPDMDDPNKVYLMDGQDQVVFNTSGRQTPLFSTEESSPLISPNFNAYSGTGTAEGGLVYVYYGRQSDYDYLAQQGINVSGHIVLARYGATFRGNIAKLAQENGAVGVLLYSDPQDFAPLGRNQTYPDTWWMPGMAVQSGSLVMVGDPLTPFYPAIKSAYRIPESKANLPSIPVQPIGYDEAEVLLGALKEVNKAPTKWQGDLKVKYFLGPELKDAGWKVKMDVKTSNKMATIYNTIGIFEGQEEPDRYVLVGNHRDAWIFGAIDPSSGTAAMLEMARAFGRMREKHGWRPRRSLVFCSWGAEEYGLIGSYEWVEEHAKVLGTRAVAYLNIDMAVQGNYSLRGRAAPLLQKVLVESSKKIPNPNAEEVSNGRVSVFDTWVNSFPDATHPHLPKISILGSGSDYAAFMHVIGVPSMDFRYYYKEKVGSHPLYHTLYETYHLVANVIDKGFVHHRAVAQLWAEVALNLTESTVLPFDIQGYSAYLNASFNDIKLRYGDRLITNGANLDYFEAALNDFAEATQNFASVTLQRLDIKNAMAVRRVNDQLIQLERHFVDPHGLPNRPEFNHIVFAPSANDNYASTSFSGLTDLLETVANRTESESPSEWEQIKQHLSVISYCIQSAAKSLSDHL